MEMHFEAAHLASIPPAVRTKTDLSAHDLVEEGEAPAAPCVAYTGASPLQGLNQPDDIPDSAAHQGGDREVCRPGGEEGAVCMSDHSNSAAYRKKLQNTEALCHPMFPLAPCFTQLPNLPPGQPFGLLRGNGHITS